MQYTFANIWIATTTAQNTMHVVVRRITKMEKAKPPRIKSDMAKRLTKQKCAFYDRVLVVLHAVVRHLGLRRGGIRTTTIKLRRFAVSSVLHVTARSGMSATIQNGSINLFAIWRRPMDHTILPQLEALFVKYGTDKGYLGGSGWGYTSAYEKHLDPDRVRAVLEIGICGFRDIPGNVVGASLFAWRDYLPRAEIYGLDYDMRFIFNDQPRIHTEHCDAYDEAQLLAAVTKFNTKYDFICDDAVHEPDCQMDLCRMLWPFLNPGGVYAIEDICLYKLPDGDLFAHMIRPLMEQFEDMTATEYQTHKDGRLLILKKA